MSEGNRRPSFQFYPGDWLKDPALRSVSVAARGAWIDMLSMMFNSPRPGYLQHSTGKAVTRDQIGRMLGCSAHEASELVDELLDTGVCSLTDEGAIYSKRMVRDVEEYEILKAQKAAAGRLGGRPKAEAKQAESTIKAQRKQTESNPEARPKAKKSPSSSSSSSSSVTPNGLGTSSGVPRATESEGDPEYPEPSPETHSGTTGKQRDPSSPPGGVNDHDWAVACDLATLIEEARIPGEVEGAGSYLRARALVLFAELWPKRPFCRNASDPWADIVPAITDAVRQPQNGDLEALQAMRRYPDGIYPAEGAGRASRLEKLIRKWQNRRPHREAGTFNRAGTAGGIGVGS